MPHSLSSSAQRVQSALIQHGYSYQVVETTQTTRSAADAAQAIGCDVAQIVKSLVFRGRQSGQPILVIASGPNRVNEKGVAALLGEPIERADAAYVREVTGYAIGGVPPIGLATSVRTLIDKDLLRHDVVWAAAGTPNAVFSLDPADLPGMTGGTVITIR